ncbi:Uncharacterised protein [Yersinia pseudotuberculosis]|uniref:Uncharacterized protein n=1 Tax=Yersinia pseudotuberculosis TaxID=633 RepID=A0A380QAL2_YERPU|nr:Uncharacterised protein [Yersinia pseudotuberculosis]
MTARIFNQDIAFFIENLFLISSKYITNIVVITIRNHIF